MSALSRCYNINDLRLAAKRRLPRGVFEFVDRGSEDEVALRNNRAAFERIKLRHRALVDVSGRQHGHHAVRQARQHADGDRTDRRRRAVLVLGELELAKAAAAANIPFTMATRSMTAMETIAKEAGGRLWFQLYVWKERELSYQLIERAHRAGFEALIVTVDTIVPPNREYNPRNGFLLPFHPTARFTWDIAMHPDWFFRVLMHYLTNDRHAAQRELSGPVSPADHDGSGRAGVHASGHAVLGGYPHISGQMAGRADGEGDQPAG